MRHSTTDKMAKFFSRKNFSQILLLIALFMFSACSLEARNQYIFHGDDGELEVDFAYGILNLVKSIIPGYNGDDTTNYIVNYFNNSYDETKDTKVIMSGGKVASVEGKNVSAIPTGACVKITGNIEGTLYIDGDIYGNNHGIYLNSSSSASVKNIIVNGNITGGNSWVIYITSTSVGNIIVNGYVESDSSYSSYSSSCINLNSASVENIIVNGYVTSVGTYNGINLNSASVENIIVNSDVTGGNSAYGINLNSSTSVENIIVNGDVTSSGVYYGINLISSSSISGGVYLAGETSSNSEEVVIQTNLTILPTSLWLK